MTLEQLGALEEQHRAKVLHEDWRTALVVCTLSNIWRGKDQKVVKPEDVMPWLKPKPREIRTRQTPEQLRSIIEQITLEMGGVVHRKNVPLDAK